MTTAANNATADTEATVARQLFACAAAAGTSEDKRASLLYLPDLVLEQARAIAQLRYLPQPFTVFAVTDPKLREIFAPAFADRLVQQWLVRHIEPWWNQRFIDDSYANRKGKGTQAAVARLQRFMRQPGHRWCCKLDIKAFFPTIHRATVLQLWHQALPKLPYPPATRRMLDQVATAILTQNPTHPAPTPSGRRSLLAQIPSHKSLYHAQAGTGMPIGSLTSQFFANVYLNELDQFVKHTLQVRGYLRYVDDFILLADNPQTLLNWKTRIEQFLMQRLQLELHPQKTVLQRCHQGLDFLGSIVFPNHLLSRQRSVHALNRRLAWFQGLVSGQVQNVKHMKHTKHTPPHTPPSGTWQRWLANHQALAAPGVPTAALLERMLATINSYYGVFSHANTWRLRRHIYHKKLGPLQRFFLPDGPAYRHLKIRKIWCT